MTSGGARTKTPCGRDAVHTGSCAPGLGNPPWDGETSRVTIFEAAMGPQIGGAIVAMQYGLSASLITLMVGVGIALSFLTLPLWYFGLGMV
jgi:predicted permease